MLKNYFIHVITIKRAETNFIAVKGLRIRQNITVALSPTAGARSSWLRTLAPLNLRRRCNSWLTCALSILYPEATSDVCTIRYGAPWTQNYRFCSLIFFSYLLRAVSRIRATLHKCWWKNVMPKRTFWRAWKWRRWREWCCCWRTTRWQPPVEFQQLHVQTNRHQPYAM